jgi:hypothetical protein
LMVSNDALVARTVSIGLAAVEAQMPGVFNSESF